MKNNLLFGFDMVLIVATVVFCVITFQKSMLTTYDKMYEETKIEQQAEKAKVSTKTNN